MGQKSEADSLIEAYKSQVDTYDKIIKDCEKRIEDY